MNYMGQAYLANDDMTADSASASQASGPLVRSLRSIFCPDRDTPDKSTKLGTSLH